MTSDNASTTKTTGSKTTGSSQGPFTAWQGMTFGTWLRFLSMRPPVDFSHSPQLAICTACSISNSINRIIERAIYGRQVEKVQFPGPPLFVIGHWRSGTTFLHTLLAEDTRFVTPNTYEILNPHHFLLTESTVVKYTKWLLPKTRPMDNMKLTWDAPQEDESALLNLTLSSPYLMLAFQNQRKLYERYFDMKDVDAGELQRWKRAFMYFVKKLTLKTGKQILLKSPTHSYRIPLLLEMFPDAHFVNILRDPYAVFNSSIHMRHKMFAANALANIPKWDHEEETFLNYRNLFERYHADKHLIPSDRLYEIRYEDLERAPVEELGKLYDYFGWSGYAAVAKAIEGHLQKLGDYQKNEFCMEAGLKRRIYENCRETFKRYGYASGFEDFQQQEEPAHTASAHEVSAGMTP